LNPRAQIASFELELLKKISGKGNVIVEIGSYAGYVTSALAENNKIIAVDPLLPDYDLRNGASADMDGVEELFLSRIKGKNVVWYRKKSEAVLKNWHTEIYGVFIDAEHSTKALTIDLGWIKHVKPGGFLAFHDYGIWPDVTRLLDKEVCPKYKEIGRTGYLIVFRK